MNEQELKLRTKKFAIEVVYLVRIFPKTEEARIIGKQLLRAATSVGANYRAVCRARSTADFISKLGIVVEESDECCFWLEVTIESGILNHERVKVLLKEANEITAIMVSSVKTAVKSKS